MSEKLDLDIRTPIELITIKAIARLIRGARGTCIYVSPQKIARTIGLPIKAVVLSEVRYTLEKLVHLGYATYVGKRSRKHTYVITNESKLWKIVKGQVVRPNEANA